MKLSLGFSPCPNDTYIFDAMVNGKIDTEGINFNFILEDVETLNQKALRGELDITKLSFHAFSYCTKDYQLLHAGSALGNNCGPLLISKNKIAPTNINDLSIAIPGEYTTANFLLHYAFPNANNKISMVFDNIESAVLNEKTDLGVIIHENRFTYKEKGLQKILDLGAYWEEKTQMPIPLGGIVIKRNISDSIKKKVDRILKRSIDFAHKQNKLSDFVKNNAQEMDINIMQQHIDLYVNDYTNNLGTKGERAIKTMFETGRAYNFLPQYNENIFI